MRFRILSLLFSIGWVFLLVGCLSPAPQSQNVQPLSGDGHDISLRASKLKSVNCFKGVPKIKTPEASYKFLNNAGYDVGYSETRKDPLWAAYTLRGDQELYTVTRPKNKFVTDKRVSGGVTHDDYSNSDYERGHMAPSDAIGQWYGNTAQLGTFIVTNICPQTATLNKGPWGGLEAAEVYKYSDTFKQIWVICGPIFDDHPQKIHNDVQVPAAFYKIIVENDGDEPKVLTVIMKQTDGGPSHKLSEFTKHVTVSMIEEKTGLDFFSELDDDIEQRVENMEADPTTWSTNMILSANTIRSAGHSKEK